MVTRLAHACLLAAALGAPLLGPHAARSEVGTGGWPSEPLRALSHRDKLFGSALTADALWVVGFPGLVLRSADHGQSFVRERVDSHDALFAIAFNAAGKGAIVGRSGLVLVTEDGGKSFARRPAKVGDEAPNLFAVSVAPGGALLAVGEFGAIVRSDDGGKSWSRSPYDARRPTAEAGAGGAVGALAHRSAEEENEGAIEEARLLGVQWVDDQRSFAVGEFGLVLFSEDAGRSFRRLDSATDKMLFGLSAGSAEHVVAAGSDGTFVESRDGGHSFTATTLGTGQHLFGVWSDARRTLAFGADGALFLREGAGAFTRIASGVHTWLQSASFDAAGRGVLVGGRGYVLHSSDGGKSQRRVFGE